MATSGAARMGPLTLRRTRASTIAIQFGAVVIIVGTAATAGFAAARNPIIAILAFFGLLTVLTATTNVLMAVALLSASFFFENYLAGGAGFLTPAKAVGVVAAGAWVLDWARKREPAMTVPHVWWIAGLNIWVIASLAVAVDEKQAVIFATRYVLFFALFFLVVQTVRGSRRRADVIIDVSVAAAAAAAVIGAVAFLKGNVDRASGPILDPNDFGFLLASIVPLTAYRIVSATHPARRMLAIVALPCICVGLLATFSRSALIGLAGAGAWLIVTRRVRLRWGVIALGGMLLAAAIAYEIQPQRIQNAFTQKQHIAEYNVSSRFALWRLAMQEFGRSPILGVGVGNYQTHFAELNAPPDLQEAQYTTHNAFLNVLAEQGAPGLALFAGYLITSWLWLRRRSRDPAVDRLRTALAAGFVVAVVGSMFLTEQYYAPIWLLPALGATLPHDEPVADPSVTTDEADRQLSVP